MRIYSDLGRKEARILSLVYQVAEQEDSIAADLDREIRIRWSFTQRKLSNAS
jgi:hypothetical protein